MRVVLYRTLRLSSLSSFSPGSSNAAEGSLDDAEEAVCGSILRRFAGSACTNRCLRERSRPRCSNIKPCVSLALGQVAEAQSVVDIAGVDGTDRCSRRRCSPALSRC
mgnify:CR=1 FL=1